VIDKLYINYWVTMPLDKIKSCTSIVKLGD